MVVIAFLIAGVLTLSAFFSGSEAALLTITPSEVETLVKRKVKGAILLQRIKFTMNRSIIAIVIMNNVVNIMGSVWIGNTVLALYGDTALAVVTAVLTLAVIVFSEIFPKTLGMHYAHRIIIPVAVVIAGLTFVLFPVIIVLEYITKLLSHGDGRKIGTEEEIRSLVNIGRRYGHIESDEGQLIHRAFVLNDKKAKDIMTPLAKMVGIPEDATIREAATQVFHHTYSRYPVFGPTSDEVRGLAMSYDILEALTEGRDNDSVMTIVRPGLMISSKKRVDHLLTQFRDAHIHLAIVQEDKKTVGLVTLEDVLEELVGEIDDEADVEHQERASRPA